MNQIKKFSALMASVMLVMCLGWNVQFCLADTFSARVVHVIDGDTLVVKSGKKKIRIRLWGIDSPEKGQPFSAEAKSFASKMLLGHRVTIKAIDRDDYGRVVAEVFLRKLNISEELVRYGHAWVYVFYCRKRRCHAWRLLESEAREVGKGLWAAKDPVAPWVWRRTMRKESRSP